MTPSSAPLPRHIRTPLTLGASALLAFIVIITGGALFAPLSTSIHASGTLVSSRPSYELQHAFGGQISWVGIRPQQQVVKGQPLMRFDVSLEQNALSETLSQIALLTRQNTAIKAVVQGKLDQLPVDETTLGIVQKFRYEAQANTFKTDALRTRSRSLRTQAEAVTRQIDLLAKRLVLLGDLEDRQQSLLASALSTESEADRVTISMLELAGQKEERQAELSSLHHNLTQSDTDIKALKAEYSASLLRRYHDNRDRLSEMNKNQAQLKAIIDAAILVSPIDGHVHLLNFDSPHMYAPRGQTLVMVVQKLDHPRVHLIIQTAQIDQIHTGMTGRMTISSLPSRETPPIDVKITAISFMAARDNTGSSLGYNAEAMLEEHSFNAARDALQERFRLSADMPVSVVLEGRKTTLAGFLFAPWLSAFSVALQD